MKEFSLTANETIATPELRTAFGELIKQSINSKDPAEGARILYDDEPRQMRFDFSYSTRRNS